MPSSARPPASSSPARKSLWHALPFLTTSVRVDVREPFHTPLHVHQALGRAFDFGHHALEADPNGITLRKDLFGSLEDGIFSGGLPSLIRIETVERAEGRANRLDRSATQERGALERSGRRDVVVHFGSPHRAVLDFAFGGLFLAGAVSALVSGATTLAGCLAIALVAGLVPALWLEGRARRRFLAGLAEATGARADENRRRAA